MMISSQAWMVDYGIALLDELAQPELDTGQMVRISDIAIENFANYLVPGLRKSLSPAADSFRSWLKDQGRTDSINLLRLFESGLSFSCLNKLLIYRRAGYYPLI